MKINNQSINTVNVNTIIQRVNSVENQLQYLYNLCDINSLRLKEIEQTCHYFSENKPFLDKWLQAQVSLNAPQATFNLDGVLAKVDRLKTSHVSNLEYLDKYQKSIEYAKSTLGKYISLECRNLNPKRTDSIEVQLLEVTEYLSNTVSKMLVKYNDYDGLVIKLNEIINVNLFRKYLEFDFLEVK